MLSLLPLLGIALAVPTVPAHGPARAASTPGDGPPPAIRLDLSNDGAYLPSDWARVFVQSERDGYLLVVHADPAGRVRVLFPVDPTDDQFIAGGHRFEIRSRGDREAFAAGPDLGVGLVYAAWSPDPFRFDEYRRGERWDLRDLVVPMAELDMETGLTNLVSEMAPVGGYDYDALRYVVEDSPSYATTAIYDGTLTSCWDCGATSTIYVGVGIGSPWYWDGWYSPYYYPWYGYRYAYGYYPYYPYYPRYYAPYPYYPYYGYGYGYGRGYAAGYPAHRDRYGYYASSGGGYHFKNVNDATASGSAGWRDRGLPTSASTASGRRLPSMGESALGSDRGAFSGRRTVTSSADASRSVRTPATTTGRRTTPAAAQPVQDQPAGARQSPAASRDRQSATPARRSTTEGQERQGRSSEPGRASTTPRRSNADRSALPTDARQSPALPRRATATPTSRQSPATGQARPAARRVERPDRPRLERRTTTQPGASAGRSTAPPQRATPSTSRERPSASPRGGSSSRPSAAPSRGSSSSSRPSASPSRGSSPSRPSAGSSKSGGSRPAPSGGGGRSGGRRGGG